MLETIEARPLLGSQKLWLYEHKVVATLSWPLMSYDFTISSVRVLQAAAQRFHKKWAGLHATATAELCR